MSHLGRRFLQALIATQNSYLRSVRALNQRWANSFLPYVLISLPLVLVTLLDWMALVPAVLLFCLTILYEYSVQRDAALFEILQPESHWKYITPLCFFISFWGLLMFRFESIRPLNVVTGYALLLIYLMLPVVRVRKQAKRKERLLPFNKVFIGLSSLVFAQFIWGIL